MDSSAAKVLALALLACGCGGTDDESGAEPPSCVEESISGLVPIEVREIDVRGRGDDFTPTIVPGTQGDFEDIVFGWIPEEQVEAEIALLLDGVEPTQELLYGRKLYVLEECGGRDTGGGVVGTLKTVSASPGGVVLFVVEGCEGDCKVTIERSYPYYN